MIWSWKRFWLAMAAAAFFAMMGLGVRFAEDGQVGYTNDVSMWVFVVAGLFVYYALIALYQLWRRKGRRRPKTPTSST